MTSSLISDIPLAKCYLHQKHRQQPTHKPPGKQRQCSDGGGRNSYRMRQKYSQHLLAYSTLTILVYLCWLPDFIVALKDVSVTIPQAVKRGSNAMLTCNYDMENDTLYSVKWYKGRREFYRYTPKENPAMKVFPSQNGLNVERNLSNQSHVVLLAVPLNVSGKFTCEISVEAPSFQTAMVSGEMEVVELPEEQATVTGIQPRYRIGDLVDGNCSIKYSKPAANLTWTINGIVVPPHHIKTYQIEKYEETNLESVMSAIHFMVTTQHFIKGQMRLKCTANIFDIFKEEIESIIEEDRPRIMASGQSYPPDHGYGGGGHNDGDGYEHNESYLTYFSAPKSSASRSAEFMVWTFFKYSQQKLIKSCHMLLLLMSVDIKEHILESPLTTTLVNNMRNYLLEINQIKINSATSLQQQYKQVMLIKYITTATVAILLLMAELLRKSLRKRFQMTVERQVACNYTESIRQSKTRKQAKGNFQTMNLWHKMRYRLGKKVIQQETKISYQDANNNDDDDDDDDCQAKCEQQKQQHDTNCLEAANQNVVNEKSSPKDTNIITMNRNRIDCQHQISQAIAVMRLLSLDKSANSTPPALLTSLLSSSSSSSFSSLLSCCSSSSSLSSTTLGYRKTYALDSFPLYAATLDASESNNAKYMSKDQTLLMTSTVTATITCTAVYVAVTVATAASLLLSELTFATTPKTLAPSTATTHCTYTCLYKTTLSPSPLAPVSESKLLQTSVVASSLKLLSSLAFPLQFPYEQCSIIFFVRNNYLMAFIGELLLHQC